MFSVVVWLTLGSKTTRLGLRDDHGSGSANKTTSFGFTQDTNCDDYTRIKKSSLFEVLSDETAGHTKFSWRQCCK